MARKLNTDKKLYKEDLKSLTNFFYKPNKGEIEYNKVKPGKTKYKILIKNFNNHKVYTYNNMYPYIIFEVNLLNGFDDYKCNDDNFYDFHFPLKTLETAWKNHIGQDFIKKSGIYDVEIEFVRENIRITDIKSIRIINVR